MTSGLPQTPQSRRGRSAQSVEPLAPTGAVAPDLTNHDSVTLSRRLVVVRFSLA